MSLLIKNGQVVTATDSFVGDIHCQGETIVALGRDLAVPADATVIDATGKLVFPGFIDPHVHIYLPFMGTYAKDTYDSASRAALVGGTTTLIEMVCPGRAEDPVQAYHQWKAKAEGTSACDFAFHMGVTRFDESTPAAMREIVADGTASFKVFLAYKGALGVDDDELYQTLKLAKELGVIVTAHCENESLVAKLQAELLASGKTGPEWHEPSRPVQVETEGVRHLMTFAELTGAHVYVVHTSCKGAVHAATEARLRGVNAWVETVIPYLVLDDTAAQRGPATGHADFEGAKFVMSPPIRAARHQPFLWDALRSRAVSTVATDHAPFDFQGQKEMGRGDFTKIPNGIPSVEHRIRLLYTHGVATGRIDLNTFVDAASTQAAKLFGLFPRKGTIAVGADADLVVYDPGVEETLSAETHLMATDYDAFEGWRVQGRCEAVTVRGEVMVRDGKFVGQLGHGQFLKRQPTHF
ncbi:dihydropyrimidinase [Botrimarina hoheduenensis]|uniref:D-hydantoinase n=1 Tax=Botrimarina hoheduenensis TaxID=2528000 RepID=A0A5C5VS45_9BACT|nr:dihydropyrimidinase [Botrimarina hoheduenensis]TWT41428.1 D-hydantoinase [Botrimarina hoheduenensis]